MKLGLNISTAVSGAEFTPENLSGLQFWYKKGTGITTAASAPAADGEPVYGWEDQSGNTRHATGASPRFTYNAATGGIEGAGSAKLNITQIDFTGQFSFWVRLKFDTISGGATDIMFNDGIGASDDDFFRIQSTSIIRSKIGGSTAMNYATTIATGTYYNIGFERDGGDDCRAYIGTAEQGSEVNNTNEFNLDRVVGAFDGICLEIVVTNAALSTADRSRLDTYLTNI